jgi:hypothetical protein
MFRTNTPNMFVAEQYGLRNTTSWWFKDLASAKYSKEFL